MGLFGLRRDGIALPPAQLLFVSTLFVLPVVHPPLFGWLNGFLAVPICYVMFVHGEATGLNIIRLSLLLVGVTAFLMQRLEVYLFSLTLVPLGFSLYAGARHNMSAAASGARGFALLALGWLLFWTGYGVLTGTNPYTSLLKALDLGFQQAIEIYGSQDMELTPDMVYSLHSMTDHLRETIPRLLPGILTTAVMLTVWMNMVISNRLIARHDAPPWGEYATWKLPDQLVGLPIVAIIALLVGNGTIIQDIGGCLLFVSAVLYLFQGLAVFIALLKRWKVPVFVRIMLYGIVLLQSYSLIFLAILGISDVWFNVRQQPNER